MPCQHLVLHRAADLTVGCSWSRLPAAAEPGHWPQRRCPITLVLHRSYKSPAGTDLSPLISVLLGLRASQLILAVRNRFGIPLGWEKTCMQLGDPSLGKEHLLTPIFSQADLRRPVSDGAQSYETCSSGLAVLAPSSPLCMQRSHIPCGYPVCSPKAAH